MTRTEDDLRSMYRAASSEDAERNVVTWIQQQMPPDPAHRRGTAHRWAAPVGAAVAVAAVTITAVAFVPQGRGPAGREVATGPGTASVRVSISPTPTSIAASSAASGDGVPLTAQVAQQTLLDLLPRQGTVTNRAGAAAPGQALTELTFDDGHGPAGIDLAVSYSVNGTSNTAWVCAQSNHTGTCTTRPDGSQLFTLQGYEYPDRRVDTLDWTVALLRPDGMQIQISEWNAPTEKDSPISRPAPPFTIAELATVVTSPAWTSNVSAAAAQKAAALFTPDNRLAPPTSLPTGVTPTKPSR